MPDRLFLDNQGLATDDSMSGIPAFESFSAFQTHQLLRGAYPGQ